MTDRPPGRYGEVRIVLLVDNKDGRPRSIRRTLSCRLLGRQRWCGYGVVARDPFQTRAAIILSFFSLRKKKRKQRSDLSEAIVCFLPKFSGLHPAILPTTKEASSVSKSPAPQQARATAGEH